MAIIITLAIAVFCLAYACWLHIYYKGEAFNYRKKREKEEARFHKNCKVLDIVNRTTRRFAVNASLAELCEANKRMEKEIKKYKLI